MAAAKAVRPRGSGAERTLGRPPSGRRELVREIAAESFATRGVGAVTMRELGEACGVTAASIYEYSDSKNRLVLDVIQRFVDDLEPAVRDAAAADVGPVLRLRGMVVAAMHSQLAHRNEAAIVYNDWAYIRLNIVFAGVVSAIHRHRTYWELCVRQAAAAGLLRSGLSTDLAVRVIFGILAASVDTRYDGTPSWAPDVEQVADAVIGALMANDPSER